MGALAGVGYTLLTGMQVPTVRSCVAAVSYSPASRSGARHSAAPGCRRSLASSYICPESLAGASSSSARRGHRNHHAPSLRRSALLGPRDDGIVGRILRSGASLIATGCGGNRFDSRLLYTTSTRPAGALARTCCHSLDDVRDHALEAAALLLEHSRTWRAIVGSDRLGDRSLLGFVATSVSFRGRWRTCPPCHAGPSPQCCSAVCGLPLAGRVRWLGVIPLAIGGAAAAMSPTPDLLVTGDGRHLAITGPTGAAMVLRDRAGDFTRDLMSEAAVMTAHALLRASSRLPIAAETAASRQSIAARIAGSYWRPVERQHCLG